MAEVIVWTLVPVGGAPGLRLTAFVGEPFALSIPGEANEAMPIQWKKDGAAISDGGTLNGATATALTVDLEDIADSGSYYTTYQDHSGRELTHGPILVTVIERGSLPAANPWGWPS